MFGKKNAVRMPIMIVGLLVILLTSWFLYSYYENDISQQDSDYEQNLEIKPEDNESKTAEEEAEEYALVRSEILKNASEDESKTEEERLRIRVVYFSNLADRGMLQEALAEAMNIEKTTDEELLGKTSFYTAVAYIYQRLGDEDNAEKYDELFDKYYEQPELNGETNGAQ